MPQVVAAFEGTPKTNSETRAYSTYDWASIVTLNEQHGTPVKLVKGEDFDSPVQKMVDSARRFAGNKNQNRTLQFERTDDSLTLQFGAKGSAPAKPDAKPEQVVTGV